MVQMPTGDGGQSPQPAAGPGPGKEKLSVESGLRVCMTGSRAYPHPEHVIAFVDGLDANTTVISPNGGDALNATDKIIRTSVLERALTWEPYLVPDQGTLKRNAIMLDAADVAIAFWDGESKGMEKFIDLAIGKGKLGILITPMAIHVDGDEISLTDELLLTGIAGALPELQGRRGDG